MENIYQNPIAKRIQDGTMLSDTDLCGSCRWALRRRAANTGFEETRCNALSGRPVPTKMAQCSSYLDKGRLSLDEMSQIAWVIEAKGKHIGFLSPEELERRRINRLPQSDRPIGF